MSKGLFIVVEGMDGAGKTTAVKALYEAFNKLDVPVKVLPVPGATPFGKNIRGLIMSETGLDPMSEALLFAVDRNYTAVNVVKPLVAQGVVVIADRWNYSSYAYQGVGLDLGARYDALEAVVDDGFVPDQVVFLDVSLETSIARLEARLGENNRLDNVSIERKKKIYDGYQQCFAADSKRVYRIDAEQSIEQISELLSNYASLVVASQNAKPLDHSEE